MKTKYSGTQTEKNLMEAFAGESQARNKYTYFASKAKKEGYEQIAALFLKTADNEKEHAKLWFKELNGIGNTAENLSAAAEGEIMSGPTCIPDSLILLKKKDSLSLQSSSDLSPRLRNTTKRGIGLFLRMSRLQQYLPRAK